MLELRVPVIIRIFEKQGLVIAGIEPESG